MNWSHDLVFAWRNALKRPGMSLLIVLTLAVGIGANSAMFSVAWRALLAPLPYADGERLVKVEQHLPARDRMNAFWSLPTFEDFAAGSAVLTEVAGYSQETLPVTLADEPAAALVGVVSANFFELFGVKPELGRGFVATDDDRGAEPVALLSHDFWLAQGGDPAIVGKTIDAGGMALIVIGVLPSLPAYPDANDLWLTHSGDPYYVKRQDQSGDRDGYWFTQVFGKLADGVVVDALDADLASLAQRLEAAYPDAYQANYHFTARTLRDEMTGNARISFLLLQAMAILVLAVASANVANLNLARVSERQQELAIREAVGATRRALGLHLVIDSLLHGVIGCALGILLAFVSLDLLKEFAAQFTPLANTAQLDGVTLLFALGLSLLAALVAGLMPAFMARDINQTLKENGDKSAGASGSARRRRLLLTFQFAFAFVIMTSTGLILLSLHRLDSQDPGYDPEDVLALSMIFLPDLDQPSAQYAGQITAFTTNLDARVSALPGVLEAGFLGGRPLLDDSVYNQSQDALAVEDQAAAPGTPMFAETKLASGGYFSAVGMPLLQGRLFDDRDSPSAPLVAIVNANFATRYFPEGNVLGQRVQVLPWQTAWWTIVGVVGNVRGDSLSSDEGEVLYWNYSQQSGDVLNLYVKTNGTDAAALERDIRSIIQDLSPGQAVRSIKPLDAIKADWLAPARLRAVLMLLSGSVALLVTLSGVIGIVACNIALRRREVGVRAALGAKPTDITRLFLNQGLWLCLVGIGLGLVLMLAAIPLLTPLLYRTDTTDPTAYLLSALVLGLMVLMASWLPARRAGAMNPTEALHAE
jgi:predicted permease